MFDGENARSPKNETIGVVDSSSPSPCHRHRPKCWLLWNSCGMIRSVPTVKKADNCSMFVCGFVRNYSNCIYIYICTYTLYNMYIPIKDVIKIYKHNLCQLFFCPKTMRLQSRPDQLLGASKSGTWGFHGSWKNPTKRENMDDLYMFILENLIQMDDLGMFISWKIPFKWMIWRYPQFRKPHGIWIEDDIGEMR